jgi:hypothetical protein
MLIPIDVGAVQESKPVPNGTYDLLVTDAQEVKSQKGLPQFKLSLAIEGHTDAPNVSHYISLPGTEDDAGKQKFKTLLLKRFLTLFKLPVPSAIDTEKMAMGMVGARARAELTLSEPTESGTVYNRLNVPYLREETGGRQGVPPPPKR